MSNPGVEQANDRRTALGTLLIERGFLDEERLEEALRVGEDTGERLGEVVVRMGWASEEDLARVLAEQWHLRYFERSAISFDGEALRRMSQEDASRLEALPIQLNHEGALVVALAEPTDARLHALRGLLGDRVDFVVVAKGAIDAGLRSDLLAKQRHDADGAETGEEPETPHEEPETFAAESFENAGEEQESVEPVPLEPVATTIDFDEVARRLSEVVTGELASLRAVVIAAGEQRERDRREIERLEAELAARRDELAERDDALSSTQQMLRDLADGLARSRDAED